MSFARVIERGLVAALFGTSFLGGGTIAAQPECDILLHPAFQYHVLNQTVYFMDVSMTSGQPVFHSWSFGDSGISSMQSPSHQFSGPGPYTVTLTIHGLGLPCSSSFTRQVYVNQDNCGWSAGFELADGVTNSAHFVDSSFASDTAEVLWEFGDGATSTEPEPSHTWLLPGLHHVSLTRYDSLCVAQTGRWIDVDGNVSTCGEDLFANFSAKQITESEVLLTPEWSAVNASPQMVIWSFGDGTVDTAQVITHFYEQQAEYQVCMFMAAMVTNPIDTCFAYVCRTIPVVALAGIAERSANGMQAWPVPFSTELNLSAPWLQGACTLRLSDAAGHLVRDEQRVATGTLRLDLGDLRPGAYTLELRSGTERGRTLLLKE